MSFDRPSQLAIEKLSAGVQHAAADALTEHLLQRRKFMKTAVASATCGAWVLVPGSAHAADLLPIYTNSRGQMVFSRTAPVIAQISIAISEAFKATRAEFAEFYTFLNPLRTASQFNAWWAAIAVRFGTPAITQIINTAFPMSPAGPEIRLFDCLVAIVTTIYSAWLSASAEQYVRSRVRPRALAAGGTESTVYAWGAVAAVGVLVAFNTAISRALHEAIVAANRTNTTTQSELRRQLLTAVNNSFQYDKDMLPPAVTHTSAGYTYVEIDRRGMSFFNGNFQTPRDRYCTYDFFFRQQDLDFISNPITTQNRTWSQNLKLSFYNRRPSQGNPATFESTRTLKVLEWQRLPPFR
jgi:hypothetical protein